MKATIVLLSLAFASAPLLSGQVNCPTPTTSSTATVGPMVCQYPFNSTVLASIYYGGNVPPGSSFPSALSSAAAGITGALNTSIATQLAQLPLPSAAVGTVSLRLPGSDTPRPFSNLGPILTDRPDTVPRKGFFLSFAYQHFNFTDIDGQSLRNLNLSTSVPDLPVGNTTGTFYGAMQSTVNFSMDQYNGLFSFGLSRTTDVSVAVPINSVSMNVNSHNFQGYLYAPNISTTQPYIPLTSATQTPNISSGSASGIGDVMVDIKQQLLGQEGRYAIAVGAQVRFPTGDSNNYLGSGAYGGNFFGLVEYRGSFHGKGIAPHVKVGYQWNGQSQIMDITKKPYLNLPGGLDYAFGADFGLHRKFTIALDGVGHQYVNTPSLGTTTIALTPCSTCSITIPGSFEATTKIPNTYTTFNFSGGVKYAPAKHVLFYANVMVPVNNVGLKSDPVPLVGIGFK